MPMDRIGKGLGEAASLGASRRTQVLGVGRRHAPRGVEKTTPGRPSDPPPVPARWALEARWACAASEGAMGVRGRQEARRLEARAGLLVAALTCGEREREGDERKRETKQKQKQNKTTKFVKQNKSTKFVKQNKTKQNKTYSESGMHLGQYQHSSFSTQVPQPKHILSTPQ